MTVAADGSVQAGALFDTARPDGTALTAGAWSFPADGGEPTLLVAGTDPAPDAGGNVVPGVDYQPLAWPPGGSALLLPIGQEWLCAVPAWGHDSRRLAVHEQFRPREETCGLHGDHLSLKAVE